MEDMHWPLTLLSRAIHYKNLTHAATNIGISQPQLSRLVAKIEEHFSVVLLDRDSKRKASWTKDAMELAEVYTNYTRNLKNSIDRVLTDAFPKEVKVGALEGLISVSSNTCHSVLEDSLLEVLSLDIFDLAELQGRYSKGELDVIFTSRLPGAKKPKRMLIIGYQTLDKQMGGNNLRIESSYEYGTRKKKNSNMKQMVSNSLATRKYWINEFGGQGILPSELMIKKPKKFEPVYMLGRDELSEKLWQVFVDCAQV